MYRRELLAVGSAVLLAGCPGGGSGDYDGEAADYLVTASDVGERWSEDRTRERTYAQSGQRSGRAIDLVDGEGVLTVALAVFGSVSDAEAMLADRRESYADAGLSVAEEDVGHAAISVDDGRIASVDARRSNVFFEAFGDVELDEARRVARVQDEKLAE